MRALSIWLLLAAAPVAARADFALALGLDLAHSPSAGMFAAGDVVPSAHLVPQLAVDRGLSAFALGAQRGSLTEGMRPGERQVLAFVLGVIPGFGLGHIIAGSADWPIWLIVDVVLFVFVGFGFWWGSPWWHGAEGVGVLLFLVERFFEGYFAYRAAGGRPVASLDAIPESGALASSAPVPARLHGFALAVF